MKSNRAHRYDDGQRADGDSEAEEVAVDTRYWNNPGSLHGGDDDAEAAEAGNPYNPAAAAEKEDTLRAAVLVGNPVEVGGKEIRTLSRNNSIH